MDYPAERRAKLVAALREEGVDSILVTSPVNVSYLTGFSGESSFLAVTPSSTVLVSDFRFTEQIAEECPGLETYIRPTNQNVYQAAAHVLGRLGCRTLGFESNHLTVAEYDVLKGLLIAVEWKPVRDRVERLRVIKDPSEVVAIREAIDFAERAFAAFRGLLRPEDDEKDLCDALEGYVRRVGGTGCSFPSIVALDERAALPHAPPTRRRVGDGQLLLVDWGASGAFYNSDLTRTLAVRKISPKLEEVYAVVAKAQEKALGAVRAGVKAKDVDAVARSVITEAGYGDCFGHGLGHGLGRQVHEAPAVRPNSEDVLQPGMVITIEPGVYLPGWGGVRIEDDVLVTADGGEVLTHVPKDLRAMVAFA
jgi:Xaa-Pro aminopeptidase